jgi:hypothetical protein
MLQNTPHPEGSGLLVFADADSLARHVARLAYSRIDMVRELRVHESAGRKHRYRHHIHSPGLSDEIGRKGHLRNLKLLEFELAPESLRRIRIGRNQLHAFRLNTPVHERLDSFVECGDETQSQPCHRSYLLTPCNKFNVPRSRFNESDLRF